MKFVKLGVVGVCGIGLALLLGCGGQQPAGAKKLKIAFVSNNAEEFWSIAEAGCQKAAKELDVEAIVRKPATGDEATQKEIIDALLLQRVDGIAISVINPKNQLRYLNEIADKTNLVTQDNDAPDSKRKCYIGTNNYLAGRGLGKLVKEALPDGGKVAVFVGDMNALNAQQRRQGLLDELSDAPTPQDINAIKPTPNEQAYGKYFLHGTFTEPVVGRERAKENATAVLLTLREEKNLCLAGLWAYNPPAILTAVSDAKRLGQVKIVGFDEDNQTLQGIIDGHIQGTIVQDPFGFGYESIKLLTALAKGDKTGLPADGIKYVPHRVITKDGGTGRTGAEQFRKELNELLGKK